MQDILTIGQEICGGSQTVMAEHQEVYAEMSKLQSSWLAHLTAQVSAWAAKSLLRGTAAGSLAAPRAGGLSRLFLVCIPLLW